MRELPGGGLTLAVEGLPAPGLALRVVEEQQLLRVKVREGAWRGVGKMVRKAVQGALGARERGTSLLLFP